MKNSKFFVILISVILIIVLAGAAAFIAYFTNNFTTNLTTFYVQYGAQEIRRDMGRMKFETGVYYTFRCEYPTGFPSSEKGEHYTVNVEVNEVGKKIEYVVNERPTPLYSSKSPDVSKSFEIAKETDSFTFCIPTGTTLESILTKAYEGKEVKNIPEVDFTADDYFSLVVKSYDGNTVIRIGFGFTEKEVQNEEQN